MFPLKDQWLILNPESWILHPVCLLCGDGGILFLSSWGHEGKCEVPGGKQKPRRLSFLTHHFACCMSCLSCSRSCFCSCSLLRSAYATCLNSSDNVHLNWPTLWGGRWQGEGWNLQPTGHACKCNICNCLCGRVFLSCSALSPAILSLALFFVAAAPVGYKVATPTRGNTNNRQ